MLCPNCYANRQNLVFGWEERPDDYSYSRYNFKCKNCNFEANESKAIWEEKDLLDLDKELEILKKYLLEEKPIRNEIGRTYNEPKLHLSDYMKIIKDYGSFNKKENTTKYFSRKGDLRKIAGKYTHQEIYDIKKQIDKDLNIDYIKNIFIDLLINRAVSFEIWYDEIVNKYDKHIKKSNLFYKYRERFGSRISELYKKIDKLQDENKLLKALIKSSAIPRPEDLNKDNEIKKLKKTIKDLLSSPNELLIKKSKLKIIGFTPRDFYEKYILVSGGYKPEIKWIKDINIDLIKYQKTLKQLEDQRRLIKDLFYNSKEWMIRSNEISMRDHEKCVYCGRKCHTAHHKKSAVYNPSICLDPNNLITVCKKCENEIHNNRFEVRKTEA